MNHLGFIRRQMSAMAAASQAVDRALHSRPPRFRVDHGRLDILVPQELLDSPDVVAIQSSAGGVSTRNRAASQTPSQESAPFVLDL